LSPERTGATLLGSISTKRVRFSLLQILPKTLTRNEVIKPEGLYKHKLGTRAKGLNLN
jgi:hypothetical protein